jgi:hypothetical protein
MHRGGFLILDQPTINEKELYTKTVEAILNQYSDVASEVGGKRFGSAGELKINNKIFATLSKGKLVIKLPQQRVDELIASGKGQRFNPGHGRLMKEWLTLEPTSEKEWFLLEKQAMDFVASKN